MSNLADKTATAIGKEYNEQYQRLIDDLVDQNKAVLTEETLRALVLKHGNKLNNLAVVYRENDNNLEPSLMYHLVEHLFFSFPYSYPGNTFYFGRVENGVETVHRVNHENEDIINCVLEYLAKKKEDTKETVNHYNNDNYWVFKCRCYGVISGMPCSETFFEVVMADYFGQATEKILEKLSNPRLGSETVFSNFELWLKESFVGITIVHKEPIGILRAVDTIHRNNLPSNSFSFIVSL